MTRETICIVNWRRIRVDVCDKKKAPIRIDFKYIDSSDGVIKHVAYPLDKCNAKYLRKQLKKALKYLK